MNKYHDIPFPDHAKKQIQERYGVEFTKKQWFYFGRTLHNPKWTIRLTDAGQGCHFCACYFMEHWYLLVRAKDGTVRTAYPRLDITDTDKQILMGDDRYRRINNDEFRVWRTSQPAMPSKGRTVELPDDVELPSDVAQSTKKLLDQFCD